MSAYQAAKHAAYAFSAFLRLELAAFGIQVTTINPSYHGTPIVNTMGDKAVEMWDELPPEIKMEYGQGRGVCQNVRTWFASIAQPFC